MWQATGCSCVVRLKNVGHRCEMPWSIKGWFFWAEKAALLKKLLGMELWWNWKFRLLSGPQWKNDLNGNVDGTERVLVRRGKLVYKILLQNYRTFTESKGDLVPYKFCQLFPNISALREDLPNVSLFFPFFYFSLAIKFVYNKFCRMYGKRKYKLEMEIACFIIRLILLHEL